MGEVLYGPFFDLAPRKDPWPAEIMNEYAKLATAAAKAGWHVHQHVINNNAVTDLLDALEQVNKMQRFDHAALDAWGMSTTSRPRTSRAPRSWA